jgi:hypothetical protein
MNEQPNAQVKFALVALRRNEEFPGKWTAIDACDAVSALHPSVFSSNPYLRSVSVEKLVQLRTCRDTDVLESLERLRVTLEASLEEPWRADEGFDATFRETVTNPDFIIDARDTLFVDDEHVSAEQVEHEQFYSQVLRMEDAQRDWDEVRDLLQSDDEDECDDRPCYRPGCLCHDRF